MKYSIKEEEINKIVQFEKEIVEEIKNSVCALQDELDDWVKDSDAEIVGNLSTKLIQFMKQAQGLFLKEFDENYMENESSFVNISKSYKVGEEALETVNKMCKDIRDLLSENVFLQESETYRFHGNARFDMNDVDKKIEFITKKVGELDGAKTERLNEIKRRKEDENVLAAGLDGLASFQYSVIRNIFEESKEVLTKFKEWYDDKVNSARLTLEQATEESKSFIESLVDDKVVKQHFNTFEVNGESLPSGGVPGGLVNGITSKTGGTITSEEQMRKNNISVDDKQENTPKKSEERKLVELTESQDKLKGDTETSEEQSVKGRAEEEIVDRDPQDDTGTELEMPEELGQEAELSVIDNKLTEEAETTGQESGVSTATEASEEIKQEGENSKTDTTLKKQDKSQEGDCNDFDQSGGKEQLVQKSRNDEKCGLLMNKYQKKIDAYERMSKLFDESDENYNSYLNYAKRVHYENKFERKVNRAKKFNNSKFGKMVKDKFGFSLDETNKLDKYKAMNKYVKDLESDAKSKNKPILPYEKYKLAQELSRNGGDMERVDENVRKKIQEKAVNLYRCDMVIGKTAGAAKVTAKGIKKVSATTARNTGKVLKAVAKSAGIQEVLKECGNYAGQMAINMFFATKFPKSFATVKAIES